MTISWRGASYFEGDVAAATTQVPVPKVAGTALNDVLVMHISASYDWTGSADNITVAGWTKVTARETPSGSFYPSTAMFTKVATASEPANYTVDRGTTPGTAAANFVISIDAWVGVDTADIFASPPPVFATGAQAASGTSPSVTPDYQPCEVVWYQSHQYFRSQEDQTATWSGGTGTKRSEVIDVFNLQSTYSEAKTNLTATGTRTWTIANWAGNTPATVTSYALKEANTRVPITVQIAAPVDITATPEAVTPDKNLIGRPATVDITAAPQDSLTFELTKAVTATPDAVDVTVAVQALDPLKAYNLGAVDVTVAPQAIDPAKADTIAGVVDITVSPLKANAMGTNPDSVDITVSAYALPKAQHVAKLNPVSATVTPQKAAAGRIYDMDVVAITTEAQSAGVYIFDNRAVPIEVAVQPLEFGFSAEDTPAKRALQKTAPSQPTRVIVQSILSKEWLHWDLAVHNLTITYTLSGATVISGDFPAEVKDYRDLNLEPWGTWVHVEEGGQIRASGILQPASIDQGEKLSFEAIGVSAYPHGIPFLKEYSKLLIDPADIVRDIWAHLQEFPDAKLGVQVTGTTPLLFGTPKVDTDNTSGPYELMWWDAKDCGSEINSLAQEAPFDYVERSQWNADKTEVLHFIDIGYPRVGTRKTELVFRQDENLLAAIGPEETDGQYASQVLLLGSGEGRDKIKGYAGRIMDNRVRRVRLIDDKTVTNIGRATALSQADLNRAQALTDVTEVTINARHINAPLGSFICGDEIKVNAVVPWAGEVDQWERIISFTYSPDTEVVKLDLRRAETFDYGGA